MQTSGLLVEAYGRIRRIIRTAVEGLDEKQLSYRIDDSANSIAWLTWHAARVEDAQIADAAGIEQVWDQGWFEKFNFSSKIGKGDTGYGHTSKQVDAVKADAKLLADYYEAVSRQTKTYLEKLSDEDLDEIIDEGWNPPVTLGARLVSILIDVSQHVGQANYVHGVLKRKTN